MRISSQSFYEQNVMAMGQQQQRLFRVQQQLSTNSKFLTAGDDPVAAARSLGVSQSLSEISQYATSRQRAALSLSTEENALNSVTSILQNIKTLTVKRLPIGRFKLRIVATQDTGAQLISQRKYVGCKKSKPRTVRGHR